MFVFLLSVIIGVHAFRFLRTAEMDDFNLFVLPLFLSSLRAYVSPSMISRSYCKRVGDFKGPYTGNILIFLEFIHVIAGKTIFNLSLLKRKC